MANESEFVVGCFHYFLNQEKKEKKKKKNRNKVSYLAGITSTHFWDITVIDHISTHYSSLLILKHVHTKQVM